MARLAIGSLELEKNQLLEREKHLKKLNRGGWQNLANGWKWMSLDLWGCIASNSRPLFGAGVLDSRKVMLYTLICKRKTEEARH